MTQPGFTSLAEAVEAYYDDLRRFLRRRTGSPSMADDVVQETWLRAHASDAALPDNPRAYLYRMAGNMAVDHVRRARVRQGGAEAASQEDLAPDQVPGPGADPLEAVISQKELAALEAAVRELPARCREVFLLYRGQGLTMREIARRLSISDKTVEKHIARAMVHCRARLREAGREPCQ